MADPFYSGTAQRMSSPTTARLDSGEPTLNQKLNMLSQMADNIDRLVLSIGHALGCGEPRDMPPQSAGGPSAPMLPANAIIGDVKTVLDRVQNQADRIREYVGGH